jgi:hypothetical protein
VAASGWFKRFSISAWDLNNITWQAAEKAANKQQSATVNDSTRLVQRFNISASLSNDITCQHISSRHQQQR